MLKSQNHEPVKPLKVGFALAPDFTLMAFTGFIEVLRQAADVGDLSRPIWCSWTVMGHSLDPIKSSCGVEITPWELFREPTDFDYVILVGGLVKSLSSVPKELISYLTRATKSGVTIIGLCTASFILAQAGLLSDRRCCLHWYHAQDFRERFERVIPVMDEIFVEDRGIITSPGGTASIDLALYLVGKHFGDERVVKVLRHLVQDWNRPMTHSQVPYLGDSQEQIDQRVRKATIFMERNLSIPLSTVQMAREVGVSPRQLERLFITSLKDSPAGYFRKLRLRRAHWLLHHSDMSVTTIALECGFNNSSHLAKRYKDFFGHSPGHSRDRGAAYAPVAKEQSDSLERRVPD
ncbi:MAG: GlxA family transcriptional regulator [Deltaproteobacteria bacterium]|jgi:transcriptional regulator GlxA family with amidase domain|nr:GlxA family transcriptional regulator [Deltaproteobacteria bacterium]